MIRLRKPNKPTLLAVSELPLNSPSFQSWLNRGSVYGLLRELRLQELNALLFIILLLFKLIFWSFLFLHLTMPLNTLSCELC